MATIKRKLSDRQARGIATTETVRIGLDRREAITTLRSLALMTVPRIEERRIHVISSRIAHRKTEPRPRSLRRSSGNERRAPPTHNEVETGHSPPHRQRRQNNRPPPNKEADGDRNNITVQITNGEVRSVKCEYSLGINNNRCAT